MTTKALPRSWADWEYLGEEEDGQVLIACDDVRTGAEAMDAARTACEMTGLAVAGVATPRVQTKVLCGNEAHEYGDCTIESPCSVTVDVWVVTVTFVGDRATTCPACMGLGCTDCCHTGRP